MFAIDEIAYNSPFKKWPPLGKFAIALSLLVSSLIATSIMVPFIIFLIGLTLLILSTRLRLPWIIIIALAEGILIFLVGAFVIALVTSGDILWKVDLGFIVLNFSRQGVELGSLVFMRAMAGATVMLFFATSTPIPYFANALRQAHVPKEFVELTILIYRYSFLLLEQMETMHVAAECRLGFRGYRTSFRTTGKISVGMFIRSLDVAERSQVALSCRGFQGEFHSFRPPAKMSYKWAVASVAVFVIMYLINASITDQSIIHTILRV